MNKELRKIILISAFFLIFGGIGALVALWDGVFQMLAALFPFLWETGKMALEEYLTSPYFIVSVIMSVASVFGIWFGARGGKRLFLVVSIICELLSLVSILSNVL